MKLFWIGPLLIGLFWDHLFWQREPYTDFEGRFWTVPFPWCWLSTRWRSSRKADRRWADYVEMAQHGEVVP